MSLASLRYRHAFGYGWHVRKSVFWIEERIVLYVAGNVVIIYNTDTNAQKFIPCSEGSQGITAIAVSPSKRYVAIAETGSRALINIYDVTSLRRKKSFSSSEMTSKMFISLAFSPDGKYLLAQTAEPDWMLLYWPWEKQMKVMASLLMGSQGSGGDGQMGAGLGIASSLSPICQVALSPRDSTVVSVLSTDSLKVYRYGGKRSETICIAFPSCYW